MLLISIAGTVLESTVPSYIIILIALSVLSIVIYFFFFFLCSFLFSAGFLYEINKLSALLLAKGETKAKRY